MNEATIITFANQKGGVGKTTLCTLFANYLVAKGKRTIVIDCDGQQTIFEKRKADHKKYSDFKEPYPISRRWRWPVCAARPRRRWSPSAAGGTQTGARSGPPR